ncbi:MAG TPA: RNA polymerase subunit sigma-70 [Bacteroidales bacterium]|nr:RNA polymerase subunit sigma-70 [Bacteroidales bacterium]
MQELDNTLINKIVLLSDHEAFGKLIDIHQAEVRGLLFKLTGGDHALTDDLSQEVFIRVFKHIRKYKARAKFSTWLYRIVINVHNDYSKVRKNRYEIKGEDSLEIEESIDNSIDILRALKTLNIKERTAILLNYEKGFVHNEIASIMHMPVGTVKSCIRRGKLKLKDYFKYGE